jgi:hypothetical protein
MISPFAVADPISLSIAMSFYEDNRGLEWCQEKRGEERRGMVKHIVRRRNS